MSTYQNENTASDVGKILKILGLEPRQYNQWAFKIINETPTDIIKLQGELGECGILYTDKCLIGRDNRLFGIVKIVCMKREYFNILYKLKCQYQDSEIILHTLK